jgi:DNA segregation ATPase FtsK/SpoIIIE, S-DNA-T family
VPTDHATTLARAASQHGVDVQVVDARIGPTVTVYSLHLGRGVTPKKVEALTDVWSVAVGVPVRYAGIKNHAVLLEVPNETREPVMLDDALHPDDDRPQWLTVPFGLDAAGNPVTRELSRLPHLLVAGATGQGKSVFLNALLVSLLRQADPDALSLILVDPKQVELARYATLPHLALPVATDPDEAREALVYAVDVMESRYGRMRVRGQLVTDERPLVIVLDEIADLMLSHKKVIEPLLLKLAAKGRAAGVHLVLATQSPRVDVLTGTLKTNVPSRIAFTVPTMTDSRVILDSNGAETLTGAGDALLSLAGVMGLIRVQAPMVTDEEVVQVVAAAVHLHAATHPPEPEPIPDDEVEAVFAIADDVAMSPTTTLELVDNTAPAPIQLEPAGRPLSLDDQLRVELLDEARDRKAATSERLDYLERALAIVCETLAANGITLPDIPKEA